MAAIVYCQPQRVRHVFVDGHPVVRTGQLVNVDEDAVAREGHRLGARTALS